MLLAWQLHLQKFCSVDKRCKLHSKAQSSYILKEVFLRLSYYCRLTGRQCYTYQMGLEVPVLMAVVELLILKKHLRKVVEESEFIRLSLILAYTRSKYCESDFITKLMFT